MYSITDCYYQHEHKESKCTATQYSTCYCTVHSTQLDCIVDGLRDAVAIRKSKSTRSELLIAYARHHTVLSTASVLKKRHNELMSRRTHSVKRYDIYLNKNSIPSFHHHPMLLRFFQLQNTYINTITSEGYFKLLLLEIDDILYHAISCGTNILQYLYSTVMNSGLILKFCLHGTSPCAQGSDAQRYPYMLSTHNTT